MRCERCPGRAAGRRALLPRLRRPATRRRAGRAHGAVAAGHDGVDPHRHAPGRRRHGQARPRRRARAPDRARHGLRRQVPDSRVRRPRRHGRGLPRRRPQAGADGRAQVPAARARERPDLPMLLAEVRHARQVSHPNICRVYDVGEVGGQPLHLDGVRRRRGPGGAAAPHRPPAGGQGDAGGAPDLRRDRRGARPGDPAPRPQAGEHHARRARPRAHHRLRPGAGAGEAAGRGRPRRRHARLHGAGAAAHGQGRRRARTSTRWGSSCTSCSPASASTPRPTSPRCGRSTPRARSRCRRSRPRGLDPAIERVVRLPRARPARSSLLGAAVAAALPGGDPLAAALAAAQQRADRIGAFRAELAELRKAGVLAVDAAQLRAVEAFQEGVAGRPRPPLRHRCQPARQAAIARHADRLADRGGRLQLRDLVLLPPVLGLPGPARAARAAGARPDRGRARHGCVARRERLRTSPGSSPASRSRSSPRT